MTQTALYFRKITLATVRKQIRGGYGGGVRKNSSPREKKLKMQTKIFVVASFRNEIIYVNASVGRVY